MTQCNRPRGVAYSQKKGGDTHEAINHRRSFSVGYSREFHILEQPAGV